MNNNQNVIDKNAFRPRSVLANNLGALMRHGSGPRTQLELARRSGIAQATIGRILTQQSAASIETVAAIALCYGIEAWQLLVAGMDPNNPPVLQPVSQAEKALYQRLKEAAVAIAALIPHEGTNKPE